jgi:hypothetical protein
MRTGRTGPLKPFNLDASKVSLWLSCRLQCNDRPTAEWSLVRTFPRPQSNSRRLRYTHVPNCAWRGRTGKLGRCRAAEETVRGEFEGLFHCEFRRKARHYEHDARIENAIPDLYRQMDTQDFVFAERAASPTRGVAPAHRKCLAADAYQNPSQSRIHNIDLKARDVVEGHCGRVFPDPTGKHDHRSTRRHVPLGETILQGGQC